MNFLPATIEEYIEVHSEKEPAYLAELSRETWQKVLNPRMLSGHVQGRFLSILSKIIHPSRILEIGTYTGYSALCMAEGLPEGGKLVTIDVNEELKDIQDKYFKLSPYGDSIQRLFGDAATLLKRMDLDFNLVFIDADKENYINYYQLIIDRLPAGAVLLFDNVLWSGKVAEPAVDKDIETKVLQELNMIIRDDVRVENVMLPLRDGVMIARKR